MADVNLNALVDGLSGKVGKKIVMRQRGGRTLLSSRPTFSGEVTAKQQQARDRFAEAAKFAKGALSNPDVKADYKSSVKGDAFQNAFTAAITDYLSAPEIASIDLAAYKGNVGDSIVIAAAKEFKLITVSVSIQKADGTVIESGAAVAMDDARLAWSYKAGIAIADLTGVKVVVTATDRPGKIATMMKPI